MTEKEIREQIKNGIVDWFYISANQKLSESFIREFKNEVDWDYISCDQKLTESFIKEFKYKVNWSCISQYQKLSGDFIREFKYKVNWSCISQYQKLSGDFIREFEYKVNWDSIFRYQKLSEDFIREFKYEVNWYCIFKYQKLSEDFIREFKDKVDWYWISKYQKLNEDFIKEFNLEIRPLEDSWLYASKQYKLDYIKNNTNYEVINDEYIIAYKSVRSDYYSIFNFQYKYEIGKAYESNCDCNLDNKNSFGLSSWTKEGALEYYNIGKLLKVKINIEDIGAIVYENNKIRSFKLEVLEEIEF